MKDYKNFVNEEAVDNTALLNYVMANMYKLATSDNDNLKPLILLLAATVMSNMNDAKATQMGRRLAQLAVTTNKKDESK